MLERELEDQDSEELTPLINSEELTPLINSKSLTQHKISKKSILKSSNYKMSTKSSELVDPNEIGRKGQKARRRVPQPQLLPN